GFVYGVLGVCALLLLLVFLFPKVNNAHRWIVFKGFSAQPSELAKIALVIFLAWFLSERERDGELNNFWATVAPAGREHWLARRLAPVEGRRSNALDTENA